MLENSLRGGGASPWLCNSGRSRPPAAEDCWWPMADPSGAGAFLTPGAPAPQGLLRLGDWCCGDRRVAWKWVPGGFLGQVFGIRPYVFYIRS